MNPQVRFVYFGAASQEPASEWEVAVLRCPVEDRHAILELDFEGALVQGREQEPGEVTFGTQEGADVCEGEGLGDEVDELVGEG